MVNPRSPFGNFVKNRPQAVPQLANPGVPLLGQPETQVFDPTKDPRFPLLANCPTGCIGVSLQISILLPNPENAGKNWKARCSECNCYWEVDPSARRVNVRPFEQQVAEAMMSIQKKLQAQAQAGGPPPGGV